MALPRQRPLVAAIVLATSLLVLNVLRQILSHRP